MTDRSNGFSRRRFLGGLATSALIVGTTGLKAPAFARNNVLDFRVGADPLLLHFNENSLGMSPNALAAAQKAVRDKGNRYADDSVGTLRAMLAAKHGLLKSQVMLGNGSTEVIRAALAFTGKSGGTLIEPKPTFGDASRYARTFGVPVKTVPVADGFKTDIAAMQAVAAATPGPLLINLCTPNNPTGTVIDANEIEAWVKAAPSHHMFLIDEAYHDYAIGMAGYRSMDALIAAGQENVLVARTFSKVYGMAGMRIGYGIAAPETAKRIAPFATAFNLNAAGAAAAIASLNDTDFHARSVASNTAAKTILTNTLQDLDLAYIPSATNFVLHRINSDLDTYKTRMADNGILVGRRMTEEDGWNRISIGTPTEMEAFSRTLRAFRQKGWA